ncbi:hypothetical protein CYMTET_46302, partial [Cymbomonas tetramitiformis]
VDRVTADHSATEQQELQRMQSSGRMKICTGDGAPPKVSMKGHKGKERVLRVMRSFGNLKAAELGVACDPELTPINVLGDTDEAYVLWASSGIFKFMSDEEVMTLVANENIEDSVLQLIHNVKAGTRNEAAAIAAGAEGRSQNMASDCSVIVIRFRRHIYIEPKPFTEREGILQLEELTIALKDSIGAKFMDEADHFWNVNTMQA